MHPDLSPSLRILLALEKGPLDYLNLARATGLSTTTIYRYFLAMNAKGWVRSPRRGVYELTEAGREELERRRRELCKILRCGGERQ